MADKQTGTGASGKQQKPKGQGRNETGHDVKTSTDNRSRQIKDNNKSTQKTDRNTNRP